MPVTTMMPAAMKGAAVGTEHFWKELFGFKMHKEESNFAAGPRRYPLLISYHITINTDSRYHIYPTPPNTRTPKNPPPEPSNRSKQTHTLHSPTIHQTKNTQIKEPSRLATRYPSPPSTPLNRSSLLPPTTTTTTTTGPPHPASLPPTHTYTTNHRPHITQPRPPHLVSPSSPASSTLLTRQIFF